MENPEKARQRAKEWYQKNKKRALLNAKIYSQRPEVKERNREQVKKRRILNADKIKERLAEWYKNNKEIPIKKARVWKQKNPVRAQYLRYKERSKDYGEGFEMSFEEFESIVKMPCVYCGFNDGIVGIDRINSSVGYTNENMVPCCKRCNYMKLDSTVEEWFKAMQDIFENQGYAITSSTTSRGSKSSEI